MWEFKEIRDLAIKKLSDLDIQAVEKVRLARTCHVGRWMLPALNDLARREKAMGIEEVKKLGVDYVLKIAAVREGLPVPASSDHRCYCTTCQSTPCRLANFATRQTYDFTSVIRTTFREELAGAESGGI